MLKLSLTYLSVLLAATLVAVGISASLALADTSTSPNYKFIETDLGGGGLIPSSSSNFTSDLSVGDNAVGTSSSTNFQFEAGSQTTANPVLSVGIGNADASFGAFSPTSTATATTSFSVIDYTSYGYSVQITGTTPTYNGHSLPAMASTAAPVAGQEEFGINLVKNTSPTNFGADPDLISPFAVGDASANYNTPNEFRFVNGETIASAPKSSGETSYTISYIANVSGITPGGNYTGNQVIVVTGTY